MKVSNVEEHKDDIIDIRDFYHHNYDEQAKEHEKYMIDLIFDPKKKYRIIKDKDI